ncbi:MAG: hypothetical protein ACK5HZ_12335 [Macellibacteroides fermentans]|uniref:hypothetical protein n=1 Tax=Macellibacteroides fermentans TaxID=879969 RepID=UPI003ACA1E1A
MKQVKQIIEIILLVASCFFRKSKQPKIHPHIPEDLYPPCSCNGRKGDCPSCSGCNCNPQSAPASEHPGAFEQYGAVGQGYQPVSTRNEGADGTTFSSGAANLLG